MRVLINTYLNIILFLSYQLGKSHGQFNLYDTEETSMINSFGYHCLYEHRTKTFLDSPKVVQFCIRPETIKNSSDENKSCYGTKITFSQLKSMNVNTVDLINWNAAIQIIDLYEKYLLLPHFLNENQFYCNCSLPAQFGKFCEYIFNDYEPNVYLGRSFTGIYAKKWDPSTKEHRNEHMTYYIGISCQTNFDYLDWRQICNGIVDCDHGEDEPEQLCLQMELNECNNQTEIRCRNGLCIPISFMYDYDPDCSDYTDAEYNHKGLSNSNYLQDCFFYLFPYCAEINLGWKKFSCGHSQFISYSNLMSKTDETCHNKFHLKYLNKLFHSKTEDQCWKTMICLTGFNYLFPNINCLNNQIENNIQTFCPNQFYFPPNSVVYSFIYFQYEKLNRKDWFNYTGPDLICYKKEYCQTNKIYFGQTIFKNNLTCFHVNQTRFSWISFPEYIIHLFSQCYSNISTSIIINNNNMFYKCNLSDRYISIHRVKDKVNDCFFKEDEDLNINLCLFNTNDHFKCFTNQNECIRKIFLRDRENDCRDASDESIPHWGDVCSWDQSCQMYLNHLRDEEQYHLMSFPFRELCDTIVNQNFFSIQSNETDETDCDYWPFKSTCNSPFTQCNEIWNCQNGIDEINCSKRTFLTIGIQKIFNCSVNQTYCIQFINNNTDIKLTCINPNRLGDGIIDCIGGTDERLTNNCTQFYPYDFKRRFHCMNSSLCITPYQICDTIIDCPYGDDERVCPWLFKSNASKFYCSNSSSEPIRKCYPANDKICPLGEAYWFCDLAYIYFDIPESDRIQFELYPKLNEEIQSFSFENIHSNQLLLTEQKQRSLTNQNTNSILLCNEGYPVSSFLSNSTSYFCLCPPQYYGDNCQYQSERLTVIIRLELQYTIKLSTIFRLIIYLINENNEIISHDEIVTNVPLRDANNDMRKFQIDLIDERMRNRSLYQRFKSRFVRIDSYLIKRTDIKYISSWLFNVSFSFLPVNRLVTVIVLRDEPYKKLNCKKNCGSHGKCMFYINSSNTQYCWCEQGWFGEQCHLKSSSNLCNQTSCAPGAQCVIINDNKQEIKCICPLGRFGKQCYIKSNSCFNVKCKEYQICLPLDQRISSYRCVYNDSYDEHNSRVNYIFNILIPTNISTLPLIPAIFVSHCDQKQNFLVQLDHRMYRNVPLPIYLKSLGLRSLGFVRMFYNKSTSYYYMFVLGYDKTRYWKINTTIISKNRCPNINEIFNKTILNEYSYLKRMKLYHLPCQKNHELRCFFDEYRMCICTKDHFSDCYGFDHQSIKCHFCKNDGLCLRNNSGNELWNYFCVCPKCSLGDFCELLTGNYYINFDMLIGTELKSDDSEQPFIIYLTSIILIIMIILSFIFNIISIIIFSKKKNRQVGCDLYLLSLTIISQIGIILLFLRYFYTIFSQIYIIENILFNEICCIVLEYCTRLFPSLFDWLTICISIERAYTIMKDVHFSKALALKTLKLSKWIILVVILFNILITLHRPFYLKLIYRPNLKHGISDHSWCVLDFEQTRWNTYEKFINIIHLLIPFILNLLSIIFFLFFKTKLEITTTIRTVQEKSIFVILKQQIMKYKPLIISTMIIIILELPRFLFTFILACIEYPWQRYTYLTGYLLSFLPLIGILFIYIKPSPKYKNEYRRIMKKGFCKYFYRFHE